MEKYKGMTVNERLYVSGFLNDFDKAVQRKDVNEVIRILKAVELNDLSIQPILESKGLSPNED